MSKIILDWPARPGILYDLYKSSKPITLNNRKNPYLTGLYGSFTDTEVEEFAEYYYAIGYYDEYDNYILLKSIAIFATNKNIYYTFSMFDIAEKDNAKNVFVNKITGRDFYNKNVKSVACKSSQSPGFMYLTGNSTGNGNTTNGTITSTIDELKTSDFTLELLYAPDTYSTRCYNWNRIILLGEGNTKGLLFARYNNETPYRISVQLNINGGGWSNYFNTTNALKDMEINHLCLMRRNGVFYLFIDGVLEAVDNAHLTYSIDGTGLRIGTNINNGEYTTGIYEGIRLTKGCRYPLEGFTPDEYFDPNNDIFAADTDINIKFNKNGAYDASIKNRAISIVNNNKTNVQFFDNHKYMYFNGYNSRLMGALDYILKTDDFTISFKYRINSLYSLSNPRMIVIGDVGWRGSLILYNNTSGTQIAICNSYNSHVYPNVYANPNISEVDVTYMRKDGNFYLYIDKILVNSNESYRTLPIEGSSIQIGCNVDNNDAYCGFIRDIKIYRKALYSPSTESLMDYPQVLQYKLINKSTYFDPPTLSNVINWEFDNTNNIKEFVIYRSNTPITLNNKGTKIATTSNTEYIDFDIELGRIYYYAVEINLSLINGIQFNFLGRIDTYKNNLYYSNTKLMVYADGTPGSPTYMDSSSYRTQLSTDTGTACLAGPYFKDNDGFARIACTSTTVNNTNNGRLKAVLPLNFGTDDITIDMIVMPFTTLYQSNARIFQAGNTTGTIGSGIWLYRNAATNKLSLSYYNGSSIVTAISLDELYTHYYYRITFMRKNGIFYVFIDGKLQITMADDTSMPINSDTINFFGNTTNTESFYGFADSIVVVRAALYPIEGFIPPTESFGSNHEQYNNAELIIDFYTDDQRSQKIIDKSVYKSQVEVFGDLYAYKRGFDENWFYNNGDWGLYFGSIVFGSGQNFTFEMNFIPLLFGGNQTLFSCGSHGNWGYLRVFISGDNILYLGMINHNGTYYNIGTKQLEYKEYHICLQRYNRALYLYVDGECTIINDVAPDNALDITNNMRIMRHSSNEYMRGFISSIRFTVDANQYNIYGFDKPISRLINAPLYNKVNLSAEYDQTNDGIKLTFEYDDYIKTLTLYKGYSQTVIAIDIPITNNTYIDTDIVPGEEYTYYYRISDGKNRYKSNELTIIADESYMQPVTEFKLTNIETFETNPTGKYSKRSGSPSITWNSTAQRLEIAGNTDQCFIAWDAWGNFSGDFAFEMDITFVADSAVRKHFGMFCDSNSSGIAGYRIFNIDTTFGMSIWNTTENNSVQAGITNWQVGQLYKIRAERVNYVWSYYINDVKLPREVRNNLYPNLRPGFFAYGSTIHINEIRVYQK